MKQICMIALGLFIFSSLLSAQTSITLEHHSLLETLDKTLLRCQYRQVFVKDSITKQKEEKVMLLEVGEKLSKYASLAYSKYHKQTLPQEQKEYWAAHAAKTGKPFPTELTLIAFPDALFKNFPEGKLTVIDRQFKVFIYEDNAVVPTWTLSDDTQTINGYLCKKAKTHFRGRDYEAWYAPEIAVSDGPWQFSGLPGLIFKVNDSNNYFSFECISVEKEDKTKDIYIDKGKAIKTNKEDFLLARQNFFNNPIAVLEGQGVKFGKNEKGEEMPNHPLQYIPLELSTN